MSGFLGTYTDQNYVERLEMAFVSHKDRGLFKDPVLFLEKKAFSLPEGSSAEWLWPFWRCQSEFFYLAWVYHIRVVQNGNRKCWLATYWKEKIVGRWPECKQVFIAQKEVCLSACLDTIKSHSTQFPIRQTDTACYKYASDLAVNQYCSSPVTAFVIRSYARDFSCM